MLIHLILNVESDDGRAVFGTSKREAIAEAIEEEIDALAVETDNAVYVLTVHGIGSTPEELAESVKRRHG